MIVYKIENTVNGKCYIGITSRTVEVRWNEHLSRINSTRNSRLYNAIRKYGKDNFTVTSIDSADTEAQLRELESKYIKQYDTFLEGYNCNDGGCGNLIVPYEVRLKISKALKGLKHTDETKVKMSVSKLGKSECAINFGAYTTTGNKNPKAKWFLVQTPEGTIICDKGLRAFCKANNLLHSKLSSRKHTKGYELLGTFNDYPEREYAQAGGSTSRP